MAELALNSVTKTVTYTKAGTVTTTATGSAYFNVAITNSDTTATVTITPTQRLVVTVAGASSTANFFSTSSSGTKGMWRLYNNSTASYVDTDWHTVSSLSKIDRYSVGTSTHNMGTAQTFTITKTKSTQTLAIKPQSLHANFTLTVKAGPSGKNQNSGSLYWSPSESTFTVSAKTSYTVSYNANGGTGAPASQTKWYGETLKLQTGTPTRTGYTFKGWATSSTGAVAYAAGANYTGNANLTLYAVWEPYHYDVIFDANGGTGAPAKQVKDYGINLTLTTSKPTFTGYTFKGWATSTTIAAAGTVEYQSGGTYSANAAVTLYAVWELTYQKPTLRNLKVERCDEYGVLDDEGKYALVCFDWTVFRVNTARYYGGTTPGPYADNTVSTCTVVVGSYTETPTLTGGSGSETILVGGGTFDSDTSYPTTVTITDSQTVYTSGNTATINGSLPLTFFPLDYNADATALGIFMPAPNNGDGAYFAKTIHVGVDTTAASGTTDYDIRQALTTLGWTDLLE